MPVATSPSAIPFTSRGCSLQNSAIWSKVSEVFSTSQTAVAFGINGASLMNDNSLIVCARSQVPPRKRSLKGSNLRGKALYSRAQAELQQLPRERGLLPSEMLSSDLAKGPGRTQIPG